MLSNDEIVWSSVISGFKSIGMVEFKGGDSRANDYSIKFQIKINRENKVLPESNKTCG